MRAGMGLLRCLCGSWSLSGGEGRGIAGGRRLFVHVDIVAGASGIAREVAFRWDLHSTLERMDGYFSVCMCIFVLVAKG